MSEEYELPQGWIWTTLGEICSKPQYGWTTKAVTDIGIVRLLRTTDISSGLINWNTVPHCTDIPDNLEAYKLKAGDIVISRAGSVGISYLLSSIPLDTVFASYLIRFRSYESIDRKYVAYYLQTPTYWKAIHEQSSGIALANINARKLEALTIPLAPLSEQERIVAAIEQQLSRVDAGIALFRQAQKKLKQYRASVLKAAIEGTLTAEWRAEHPDIEPASELLKCILKERRIRWEEEQRAKGKDPKKVRYVEPVGPDVSGLHSLPKGWCWATAEQVSYFTRYGSSSKTSDNAQGIPVLRMGNIQDGSLELRHLKYLPVNHPEFPNLLLKKGDLLFNRTNSPELVGKSAIYRGSPDPCSYASYLISVRMISGCIPYYLCFFLNSLYGRIWVASVVSQQVGQANVNGTKLQALTFPLPPFVEQEQIVSLVEERLSLANALETAIEHGLKRAEKERQSILHQAFTGQLVPQDPNDEPASVLLERIRKERSEREKQAKQGQRIYGEKRESNKRKQKLVAEARPIEFVQPELIDADETVQGELWQGIEA